MCSYSSPRLSRGFTFIEAVMVLGIVAVLTAVALPTYRQASMKAKRSEASVALSNLVALQQQHYLACQQFAEGFGLEESCATLAGKDVSATGLYDLTTRPVEGGFEATASARQGKTQVNDTGCTRMTLRMAQGELQREPASCF